MEWKTTFNCIELGLGCLVLQKVHPKDFEDGNKGGVNSQVIKVSNFIGIRFQVFPVKPFYVIN